MIDIDEGVIFLEYCKTHWRSYSRADSNGHINFFWWFFGLIDDDQRDDFLKYINSKMDNE